MAEEVEKKLYQYSTRIKESTDKSENVDDYMGIIKAASGGGSLRVKQLAAELIPEYFKYFPTLSVQAIDQHVNLCKDEKLEVRVQAIHGLPLFCKDTPEYVSKIVDVLVQLLPTGENVEFDAIQKSLMLSLRQYMKKDKMHQEEREDGASLDLPPSIVSPADFGPNVDLSLASQLKIGVIDGGISGTPTLDNFECFGRTPTYQSFHSCKSSAIISPHGFQCGSIIGGRSRRVDFFGVCDKEIHGVLPDARVYFYSLGCTTCKLKYSYISEAVDQAIKDGIRVISASRGPIDRASVTCPDKDDMGKLLLHAFNHHIVSCLPSGNDGPLERTAVHGMPWVITVGASTNGQILVADLEIAVRSITKIPSGVDILERIHDGEQEFMILDRIQVVSLNVINNKFGKLRTLGLVKDKECLLYGNYPCDDIVVVRVKPDVNSYIVAVSPSVSANSWASIRKEDINKLLSWEKKFRRQQLYARLLVSKYQKDERGIFVADFSSRGPTKAYPNNITPDLVAPGYSVLVSHPSQIALNEKEREKDSHVKELLNDHKIGSGASFACPTVAAYAAIVCSYHPQWNPSAIKSALITTALSFSARGIPGNEFAFGAGAVDLERALKPGLVYEELGDNFQSYIDGKREIFDLNLPTFAASFPHSHFCCEQIFTRELKNVGNCDAAYKFEVEYFNKSSSDNVMISAEPNYLEFKADEKQKFILKVKIYPRPSAYISAVVRWVPTTISQDQDRCSVSSPLIVYHHSEFDKRINYEETIRNSKK